MKKTMRRRAAGLLAVFLAGFLLAGGRDVLRPETVTRLAGWAVERVAPAPGADDARRARQAAEEDAPLPARIKRLVFLRDAVAARVPDGRLVPIEALPRPLLDAVIAVEDSRFYTHPGFDLAGIARASLVNLRRGEIEEGASTITQQLVKNLFLSQERSFARKAEELALALDFELHYSKDEILALYLNTIYFGSGFYGVRDAARGYFGKEPDRLTLPEAAMLAGLPNAPSLYSPYENFLLAKRRQLVVLDAMARTGALSAQAAEAAKLEPLYFAH